MLCYYYFFCILYSRTAAPPPLASRHNPQYSLGSCQAWEPGGPYYTLWGTQAVFYSVYYILSSTPSVLHLLYYTFCITPWILYCTVCISPCVLHTVYYIFCITHSVIQHLQRVKSRETKRVNIMSSLLSIFIHRSSDLPSFMEGFRRKDLWNITLSPTVNRTIACTCCTYWCHGPLPQAGYPTYPD